MGGQEVRWNDGGTESGMITHFFYENGSINCHRLTFFSSFSFFLFFLFLFWHKVITSAVKFVSNMMSYII